MRLYIWECENGLTQNWHSGGALVVLAESVEAARTWAIGTHDGIEAAIAGEPEVFDCSQPRCWIFPDAGCC